MKNGRSDFRMAAMADGLHLSVRSALSAWKKRQHTIALLHSIPPDAATLEEWRDIYRYLNSAPIIVPDE